MSASYHRFLHAPRGLGRRCRSAGVAGAGERRAVGLAELVALERHRQDGAVRDPSQVEALARDGARHVCDLEPGDPAAVKTGTHLDIAAWSHPLLRCSATGSLSDDTPES